MTAEQPSPAPTSPAATPTPSSHNRLAIRDLEAVLAGESVERIRSLVLHLAVQGRLTPERACDEPDPTARPAWACDALLRVMREAATAPTHDGGGRRARRVVPRYPAALDVTRSEGLAIPFGLPGGWTWRRVDEVGELKLGRQRCPQNHAGPHMRPYLRVANVHEGRIDTADVRHMSFDPDEVERFVLRSNDVLLNEGQSYELVGRAAIYRGEVPGACFQNTLIRFRPGAAVIPEFALIVFRAYLRTGRFRREAQQTTNLAHLSLGRLAAIEFPLPPVAEQERIVATVDRFLALCDELEIGQQRRRETSARFASATLEALVAAETADGFATAWQRAVDHLDLLVDVPDKLAALRTAVLDLAIRGRFATRGAADGSASQLLARLREERAAARGHESGTGEVTEAPFELPATWRWTRMDRLWRSITDGDHQPPPQTVEGVALLTIGNVSRGVHDLRSTRHVPRSYFDKLDERRVPRKGDLLYTVVGSYGIPVLVTTDQPFCVQRHIAILKPLPSTNVAFLRYVMLSSFVYRQAQAAATGIAQPTVGLTALRNLLVPLPPAAEQHRLAAILARLMSICDALETALRETGTRADQRAVAALRALVA